MCAQTAVATPSTRRVLPTYAAGCSTSALIAVDSFSETPVPSLVSPAESGRDERDERDGEQCLHQSLQVEIKGIMT